MSFKNLKSNRADAISALVNAAEKTQKTKKTYGDDRKWKPTRDKAGNGYAVIRFLPAKAGEDLPWVKYWDHGFQGPTGQWYIERSLTSLEQDDPVSELNSELWNSGDDANKEIARDRKRRLHYVSNILVINDSEHPENNGKVFLYEFGKKIFDKVMDAMQPEYEDETPVNPYDFWEGADFKIKIRKVDGWVNYDKSEFDAVSSLFDGEEDKLEAIYNKLYSLNDEIDPKSYKSYGELKAKLNKVLGITANAPISQPKSQMVIDEPTQETADYQAETSDDDTMSYFKQLAEKG